METRIRSMSAQDVPAVTRLLARIKGFSLEDQALALELVEAYLCDPQQGDYACIVASGRDDTPAGYACYGPTPLTEATYDLYWIAVDPAAQGKGFGQRLLKYVEQDLVTRGGRMLLIETSSHETYGATIRFYERSGYELVARIKNFYRLGDAKLVFSKELT